MSNAPHPREGETRAQALNPGLYVVATPIGNLRDVTLRALDVLAAADAVYAEDTRVTRKLLDAYGLTPRLEAYHDHNAAAARPRILARLAAGEIVALVSDAGTPLVSDPGYKLVRAAIEAGHCVTPIPGASAPLAALAGAGLPTDRFLFAGFAPPKPGARLAWLADLADAPATLIFFETGPRLAASLGAMADAFGDRPAAIARELTKLHEEFRRGGLAELASQLATEPPPKGEIVVLVGPPPRRERWDEAAVDAALQTELVAASLKDAASVIADASGWARKEVYARGLALKRADGAG